MTAPGFSKESNTLSLNPKPYTLNPHCAQGGVLSEVLGPKSQTVATVPVP